LIRGSLVLAAVTAAIVASAHATPITIDATLVDAPPQTRGNFGTALATGDIDGDGFADLIVGAPRPGYGRAVVLHGPSFDARTTVAAPDTAPLFGEAVAVGDVNGDGYDDVIVGSKYANVGFEQGAGQAFVFFGPDLTAWQRLLDPHPQAAAAFGVSVAAGDLNGDGYDEVIVGAWDSNIPPFVNAGQAFVYWGPSLASVSTLQSPEPQNVADFGVAVATGDFNGDGVGDAIVGSWISDVQPGDDAGQVFVFTGPSLTLLTSLRDPLPGRQVGMSVAAGDVDGDGADEVLAGAEGRALLFDHAGGALYTSERIAYPAAWGGSVTSVDVRDATGDGGPDIAIGVTTSAGAAAGTLFVAGAATERPYELTPAGSGRSVALLAGLLASSDPFADVDGIDEAGRVELAAIDDADADGWLIEDDNCPLVANPGQENADGEPIDIPSAAFDDATHPNHDDLGDACDADDDNDGLSDVDELTGAACDGIVTSPVLADTDGDLVLDGAECALGSDPLDPDSRPPPDNTATDDDGDGVRNAIETRAYNTSTSSADTDGDGCSDGREIASVNGDRAVNVLDLQAIAARAGPYGPGDDARYFDPTKDGTINVIDLQFVAVMAGSC
jgi:hypothetical protein